MGIYTVTKGNDKIDLIRLRDKCFIFDFLTGLLNAIKQGQNDIFFEVTFAHAEQR